MFSLPLFKQTIKSNGLLLMIFTAVTAILLIQFAAMEMTQFLLFLIFYGVMAMLLPAVYILISSNKLLASQVDRGSMAYVLSTPRRRSSICFTQIVYSVLGIVLMFTITTVAHIGVNAADPMSLDAIGASVGITGLTGELTPLMIAKVNLSAMVVCLAMAGICYMFSAIFNSTKHSIGFSGAFVGISVLANMMAMFGSLGIDALTNFKYISICTLYDYTSILQDTNTWLIKGAVALAVALVTYTVGSVWFTKKDLPL
jgi:ABC-2 type transport system permease protein